MGAPDGYLDRTDVADLLGYVRPGTVADLVRQGRFPEPDLMLSGQRPHWRVETVDEWLTENEGNMATRRLREVGSTATERARRRRLREMDDGLLAGGAGGEPGGGADDLTTALANVIALVATNKELDNAAKRKWVSKLIDLHAEIGAAVGGDDETEAPGSGMTPDDLDFDPLDDGTANPAAKVAEALRPGTASSTPLREHRPRRRKATVARPAEVTAAKLGGGEGAAQSAESVASMLSPPKV